MTDADILQQSWAIALGLDADDVNDGDNFFDLGGDSVQAIRLAEVARNLCLKFDVETVFNHPNFMDMLANSERIAVADSLSEDSSQGKLDDAIVRACADACGVEPEMVEDFFPVIGLQEQLMHAHIRTGGFLMQFVLVLEGTRDAASVCKAFDTIHGRNQIWRTRFAQVDGKVLQVALKDPVVWHNETDLEEYKVKDSAVRMGFGQPLVRYAVVKEPENTYLVWTCHHSLMDGWTRRLLFDDLESYLVNPVAFTAKPPRPPFKDMVEYWRSFNTEASAILKTYYGELPRTKTLYTVPDGYTANANNAITRTIAIDRPTKNPFSFSTMAYAAFALSLGQMTGTHEITLYSIRGSRAIAMPGAESIMGPMVSSVLQHVQLPPDAPISVVLRGIQDTFTRMLKYEPFHTGHVLRQPSYLNHVALNWFPPGSDLSSRMAEFSVGTDRARLRVIQELYQGIPVRWFIKIHDNGDHLKVASVFDDHLVSASTVEKFHDLFAAKLRRICEGQGMSVESLMA